MDQAILMYGLRDQLDVQSAGVDDRLRRKNDSILIEAYLHCPPRRVWLYLKRLRFYRSLDYMSNPGEDARETLDPEDVVAKGTRLSHLFHV